MVTGFVFRCTASAPSARCSQSPFEILALSTGVIFVTFRKFQTMFLCVVDVTTARQVVEHVAN
jgi:hypothetical protein